MDKHKSLAALSALSQETRLDAFRVLVKVGSEGMIAGDLARAIDVRQNTLSSALSILHQVGLVSNRREGRTVRYFADMHGMSAVLSFLLEDCCGGRPELCEPLLAELAYVS